MFRRLSFFTIMHVTDFYPFWSFVNTFHLFVLLHFNSEKWFSFFPVFPAAHFIFSLPLDFLLLHCWYLRDFSTYHLTFIFHSLSFFPLSLLLHLFCCFLAEYLSLVCHILRAYIGLIWWKAKVEFKFFSKYVVSLFPVPFLFSVPSMKAHSCAPV